MKGESFALCQYFESRMIEKHLELLEMEGAITRNGAGFSWRG